MMLNKNLADPIWYQVSAALAMARGYAWKNGYDWNGESCCAVSTLALGIVIRTRRGSRGEMTLGVDVPGASSLACADHYLQTRMDLSQYGRGIGGIFQAKEKVMIDGYDGLKRLALRLEAMPDRPGANVNFHRIGEWLDRKKLRESPDKPLSMPTEEGRQWARQGMIDGIADFNANPDSDYQPQWLQDWIHRYFKSQ
jgi:hypothetical protein